MAATVTNDELSAQARLIWRALRPSLSLSSSSLSRLFPGGFIPSSRPSAAAHCAHPFSAEQRLQGTDPCPNTGPTATTADKEARSFDQISMKNPDPLILGYEREGGGGEKKRWRILYRFYYIRCILCVLFASFEFPWNGEGFRKSQDPLGRPSLGGSLSPESYEFFGKSRR